MKSIVALLAVLGFGIGFDATAGHAQSPTKAKDKQKNLKLADEEKGVELDDPLPAGSTLRFGTSRFRHGVPIANLAVSADGKIAVAVNGGHIHGSTRVFDLVSGRALYTVERSPGIPIEAAAISPDARLIALKQDNSVCIRDAATGREFHKIDLPRADSRSINEMITFTPDGKAVAVTSEGKIVHLLSVATGNTIRDFVHTKTIFAVTFSPDGKLMAAGGHESGPQGQYFALLLEVETGKEIQRFIHGKNGGIRSLALSPDGKTLVSGGGSGDGKTRFFDVATGKLQKEFPKGGYEIKSVAFTPDSKIVAAAGDSICLYDAATGEERFRIDQKAIGLQFTDGGKTLTGAVKGAIYRWDTKTGKVLTPVSAGDSTVEQIFVTFDGRRVVTRGQNGDAHIWDGANGKHLRELKVAWQRGMAMSPNGRYLAWRVADEKVKYTDPQLPNATFEGSRVRLYDVAADKLIDRFPGFKGDAHDLTFTDGGKKLVTVDHEHGMVRLWNFEAGKEERNFRAVPEAEKNQSHYVWRTVLSPAGKKLAVAYDQNDFGGRGFGGGPHLVRLWDMVTGKEQFQLDGHLHYVLDMAFSPDGRYLVTAGEKAIDIRRMEDTINRTDQVFVWETAAGKRVAALPDGLPIGACAVAFSPDGRFLATAEPDGAIRLWEVATWTAMTEFRGHRDRPTALTFTPGGQLLSGSLDTTVLAWDSRPPHRGVPRSLEGAWDELANHESSRAFQAAGRFLKAPSEAVKFFADNIKAAEAPIAERMQQLIADLDSAKFSVRESATKAFGELGQQAKPYLEEVVKTTKSTEVLERARKILEGLKTLSPEQLRQMRVVWVLELIGDDASKDLLKKWAGGLKGAWLTEEATAALQRVEVVAKARR